MLSPGEGMLGLGCELWGKEREDLRLRGDGVDVVLAHSSLNPRSWKLEAKDSLKCQGQASGKKLRSGLREQGHAQVVKFRRECRERCHEKSGIVSFNLVVIKNILKTVVLNNVPRDIQQFWETFWLSQLRVGAVQLHLVDKGQGVC